MHKSNRLPHTFQLPDLDDWQSAIPATRSLRHAVWMPGSLHVALTAAPVWFVIACNAKEPTLRLSNIPWHECVSS
jgi:hypothetical protein